VTTRASSCPSKKTPSPSSTAYPIGTLCFFKDTGHNRVWRFIQVYSWMGTNHEIDNKEAGFNIINLNFNIY
jgi:hypothetical protein